MHAHIHTHTRTHTHSDTLMQTPVYVCERMSEYIFSHTHTHYPLSHTHFLTHTLLHTYTLQDTHTHTHTHTHSHWHTIFPQMCKSHSKAWEATLRRPNEPCGAGTDLTPVALNVEALVHGHNANRLVLPLLWHDGQLAHAAARSKFPAHSSIQASMQASKKQTWHSTN